MRILIDECLDWRLCRLLGDHFCRTVQSMGWSGIKNGELLRRAQEDFDLFITGDLNLQFQQNFHSINLAIVILAADSTRLVDTAPLINRLVDLLDELKPGTITTVSPA